MKEPQWQRRAREADGANPARMMKDSELVFEVFLAFEEDFEWITKEIILVIFYNRNDSNRYHAWHAHYLPSALPGA